MPPASWPRLSSRSDCWRRPSSWSSFARSCSTSGTLYLRHRDRLQRDVMLVFAAMAVLFVLEIVKRVFGEPPMAVGSVAVVLLLAQPYLTLRLVATLRPVRRWVVRTALAAYVVTVPLLVLLPVPPLPVLLAVVGVSALTEVVAAAYLGREAVRRSSAPR